MVFEGILTGIGWWLFDHVTWLIFAGILTALWLRIKPTRRSQIRLGVALTMYFAAIAVLPILGAILYSLQVGAFLSFPMVLVSVIRVGDEYDGMQFTLGQVIVHRIEDWLAPKREENFQ